MAASYKDTDLENSLSLPDPLEINLDEIDDTEFDIPPVEKTPTLESILNEIEDQGSLSDEEISPLLQVPEVAYTQDGEETQSLASRGSSDARSKGSSERRNRRTGIPRGTGSILRHVILKGISSQLNSANERVNAGTPTAMAVAGMIAVGTSHGLVLIFDSAQALKWCLGSASIVEESGAVSSVGFNHDCSRILVGFAKGHILMYDLSNGKLLRTLTDAHPPGTAVLHVKFTDSPTLALCSDSGGSVFELNFKRTMGVRGYDSRCLFSGSRGEVVTIEPLLLNQFGTHPLHHVVIVAMATLSKVIVVTIRPKMRVLFTHSLQSSPTTLPLLAWQFVIIQVADASRVIDPVLAFGRDSNFFFFQVSVDMCSKIRLIPLQRTKVNYQLLSLQWLNTRTLAVLDTREQVHLVDVRTQQELEVIDLSDARLVYGSSHFKGLATGGNVSKALALAGEKACYSSIVSYGNQIFVLGLRSFHVLTIRLWQDRLSHLVKQNKYIEALSLGMDFYEDRGKAVVGLKGPKSKRKELIKEKILEILNMYIDDILLKPRENATRDMYEEVISAFISYCINLDHLDMLFGKFYEAATTNAVTQAIYLESLEPFILNDQLMTLSPSITQQFVSHYERKGYLQALEACIVHLDVTSIDIHQTMTLCRLHNLYDAILYIYNRGMQDYVTPFEELITVLQKALSTGNQLTDTQITLGNKLLVYISCCMAGRAYPLGNIPADQVLSVKHEIFKCLTAIHSKNASDTEISYPYLRVLLHFDTKEFLNVLALAFEEPEFTTELGLCQRQRVVDILLLIMVNGDGYTPGQVGSLFTFLARQLAKPGSGLVVERQLFTQVVEYLTLVDGIISGQHEERQQALLELLLAPGGLQHYEQDELLRMAETAKFYRVCELLYEKRKEYDKILYCYLRDPLRRPQVFSYLRNVLVNPGYVDLEVIQQQLVDSIEDLIAIDNKKLGQIIYLHLPQSMILIADKLLNKPNILYNFLRGLFHYKESHTGYGQHKEDIPIAPELYEKYIELMCEFHPSLVTGYIKSTEGYRLDETLQIVREHDQLEATAYLLEKAGDVNGAFNLLLNKLKEEVEAVTIEEEVGENEMVWSKLNAYVVVVVQLCQRGASLLDEKGREQLWFPLLECLMEPRRNPDLTPVQMQNLKELTNHVLSSMMGYVSPPSVIQIILQHPAYKGGKFGEIRELLLSMLETSSYEQTLLQTTSRVLSTDLHARLDRELALARRPLSPRAPPPLSPLLHPQTLPSTTPACAYCLHPLHTSPTHVAVFRCGHTYHVSCLPNLPEDEMQCRLCCPVAGLAPCVTTTSIPQTSSSKSSSPIQEALSAAQFQVVEALRRSQHQACAAELRSEPEDCLELNLSPPPNRPNLRGLF